MQPAPPSEALRVEVVILGAGAAGLAAAERLRLRQISCCVLEARDRVGGRIWTIRRGRTEAPLELGAEFVHGLHPRIWSVMKRARLATKSADGPHFALIGNRLRRADALLRRAVTLFAQAGEREEPVRQFIQRKVNLHTSLGSIALAFAEGFNAARAERVSAQFIGQMSRASEQIQADRIYRVLPGYDAVTDWLARRVDRDGAQLRLNARVERVRWSHHRVEVAARGLIGHPLPAVHAKRALVTLPLGVLQASKGPGSVRFSPPLAQKAEALRRLEMGAIVKVVLRFRRPFWEERSGLAPSVRREFARFAFVHAHREPVPTWWRPIPFGDPVLVGWTGGSRAEALAGRSAAFILEQALKSLTVIFRIPLAQLESLLEVAAPVDWQADPFARGGYCVVPVGQLPLQAALGLPVEDTLFFAGEATHTGGHAGTVHGAIDSGERAANEIARSLKES